ncbi:hypothetical protein R5R35_012023 [Gryllus longicercus]|uniref:2-aminoethanethiol dioxygenase n=1 Tax=Gryllus longicercus TaxID=2509291 RepID=A0AAN9V6T4_9ORTH
MTDCVMQRVLDLALYMFKRSSYTTHEAFLENFSKLWFLATLVTADEVNLDRNLLLPPRSPVTVITVYEDDRVGISIFVLMPGAKLPLHRHPKTYGLLKVLSGRVKIQAFNVLSPSAQKKIREEKCINKKALLVEKLEEIYADESSGPRIITPGNKNCHEIYSDSGPAAIIEILSPLYDDLKPQASQPTLEWKFYSHTPVRVRYLPHADKHITILHRIESPADFYMDAAPYHGPQLIRTVGK